MQDYETVVKKVAKMNSTLRSRGFNEIEINTFWDKQIALLPKIKDVGIENIKICTGCGHLNIEPLRGSAFACCPDNNYKPVLE